MKKETRKNFSVFVSTLILLTITIEVFLRVLKIPEYFFPLPSLVFEEIYLKSNIFIPHLLITMGEAIIGFLGGNICALIAAIIFSEIRIVKLSFYPLMVGLQAVPIIAIAPFINIWFGSGLLSKAIMAGLLCYFPAVVIATNGFSSVNNDALSLLKSVGANRWQIFYHLRFPSAIPSLLSALQISSTLCTIGAIVAELSGANQGIGYLIEPRS